MTLSRGQRASDRAEAIQARREAADMLQEAKVKIEAARRKLAYQKSYMQDMELLRILSEVKDVMETLRDPEYDPD